MNLLLRLAQKDAVKQKVLNGTPKPLQNCFKDKFPSFWVKIDDRGKLGVNPADVSVMAVGSSVYSNLLSTGGVFYVVRSLAACRGFEQKRTTALIM